MATTQEIIGNPESVQTENLPTKQYNREYSFVMAETVLTVFLNNFKFQQFCFE